ncbi:MAG TPA: hypothetical protein VK200_09355, partial [Candidatus Limnocylindrales bacterium]|nr:hypothetical protein [Candidatus Limnocylindrales bacterium]
MQQRLQDILEPLCWELVDQAIGGFDYLSTIIPIVSTIPALMIPVVPSMFWAVVGVFTSVIYVIPS